MFFDNDYAENVQQRRKKCTLIKYRKYIIMDNIIIKIFKEYCSFMMYT